MKQMHQTRYCAGGELIYVTIALPVIFAIVSLAVDWGRVQAAKTELQATADSALLYGAAGLAQGLSVSQVIDRCVDAADDNTADGRVVTLDRGTDVEFGTWNATTETFRVLTGMQRAYANSVRVHARRTAAAGNPVELHFAALMGTKTCDVRTKATAMVTRVTDSTGYGFIGLESVELMGSVRADSYNSATGARDLEHGSVVTNGDITISGSVMVHGDARPGIGETLSLDTDSLVTGSTAPLTTSISWPVPDASAAAAVNNNASIPGQFLTNGGSDLRIGNNDSLTLGAGTYYFRDLDLAGGGTLNLSGETTIYLYGQLDLGGNTIAYGNRPKDLKIRMTGTGDVKLHGTSDMLVDLVAPWSDVTVSGTTDISGRIVGKTLRVNGTVGLHLDESLPAGDAGITAPAAYVLVE